MKQEQPNITFGERLKQLRIEVGLSRKDLANAVGISEVMILNYEVRDSVPTMTTMAKIIKSLNCAWEEFNGCVFPFADRRSPNVGRPKKQHD